MRHKPARICSFCRSEYKDHRCDSCGAAQPIANGPTGNLDIFFGVTMVKPEQAMVIE